MLSKELKSKLMDVLTAMSEGELERDAAICYNVDSMMQGCGCSDRELTDVDEWLRMTFARWEHFSGDINYPVPDPQHDGSACAVYMTAGNHWDKSTKYGRLRWALLDYLIEELET